MVMHDNGAEMVALWSENGFVPATTAEHTTVYLLFFFSRSRDIRARQTLDNFIRLGNRDMRAEIVIHVRFRDI